MKNGVVQLKSLKNDPDQQYYIYKPTNGEDGKKLFISVHGLSMNANEHAALFASYAEKYDVILVAPIFTLDRYPDYNRLGLGTEKRSDFALDNIIQEVCNDFRLEDNELYLFGYSAGGQFVHRYMMLYPHRISRLVIGAAGWYSFPDQSVDYPRGIKLDSEADHIHFIPETFLTVPTCVLVGENDGGNGKRFNRSPELNMQQGESRVERGRRWLTAMQEASRYRGLETEFDYKTLSNSGHGFRQCMENGNLGHYTFEFLFS